MRVAPNPKHARPLRAHKRAYAREGPWGGESPLIVFTSAQRMRHTHPLRAHARACSREGRRGREIELAVCALEKAVRDSRR
jgi:hypothetical protein